MRAGFTGSRSGMTGKQKQAVRSILEKFSEIHHGDCVGSDEQAHDISRDIGLTVVIHPPSDDSLRAWCDGDIVLEPKSYLERNKDIVNSSDFLIATPAEESGEQLRSGTWATIRYARKLKKKIFIVRSSGLIES